jgi:hypothetical protein
VIFAKLIIGEIRVKLEEVARNAIVTIILIEMSKEVVIPRPVIALNVFTTQTELIAKIVEMDILVMQNYEIADSKLNFFIVNL